MIARPAPTIAVRGCLQNSAFFSRYRWLLPLYRFVQRRSDLTIVTNESTGGQVKKNGGVPFVLEDKIPQFGECNQIMLRGKNNLVFICTFEKDEPYDRVIEAAKLVDSSVFIYVTGKYEKAPPEILKAAPSNVIFTGFLPERNYLDLLSSSDIIIDLTYMDDCLVCGAYEGLALGKPLILSDTAALREYFDAGAVYTGRNALPRYRM
jgi:glycosyltransferase involved in cell wall biosynthesis